MAKKTGEIRIYYARGMHVTAEILDKIKPHHPDWDYIDYSTVCEDEELLHKFEKAGVKGFPVITCRGHIIASGSGIMTARQVEDIIDDETK